MKSAAISFGRANPFHAGHLEVIKAIAKQPTDDHFFYLSHSFDAKKNPLPYEEKFEFVQAIVQEHFSFVEVVHSQARTLIQHVLPSLSGKYDDIVIVVGSDRVEEFRITAEKYNGRPDKAGNLLYSFDSIEVVSAGDRDPDAEGVSGMSATKMRQAAVDNDFATFRSGVPTSDTSLAREMFDRVRYHMNLSEHYRRSGQLQEDYIDKSGKDRATDAAFEVEDGGGEDQTAEQGEEAQAAEGTLGYYYQQSELESAKIEEQEAELIAAYKQPQLPTTFQLLPKQEGGEAPTSEGKPAPAATKEPSNDRLPSRVLLFLTTADPPSRLHKTINTVILKDQANLRYSKGKAEGSGGTYPLFKEAATHNLPIVVGIMKHKSQVVDPTIVANWLTTEYEAEIQAQKLFITHGNVTEILRTVAVGADEVYVIGDDSLKMQFPQFQQIFQIATKSAQGEDEGGGKLLRRVTNWSLTKVDAPNLVISALSETARTSDLFAKVGELAKGIMKESVRLREQESTALVPAGKAHDAQSNQGDGEKSGQEGKPSKDEIAELVDDLVSTETEAQNSLVVAFDKTALLTGKQALDLAHRSLVIHAFKKKAGLLLHQRLGTIFMDDSLRSAAKEFGSLLGVTQIAQLAKEVGDKHAKNVDSAEKDMSKQIPKQSTALPSSTEDKAEESQ